MPEIIGDENIQILTDTKNLFLNAECVFVEYYDVIRAPWFLLLTILGNNSRIGELLDISALKAMDGDSLFEWYVNRKDINFFNSFKDLTNISYDKDILLEGLIQDKIFYSDYVKLNSFDPIQQLSYTKMVNKIIFYTPIENKFIKEDINMNFNNKICEYKYGDFSDILKSIPKDSTFIFSDINKIITLEENNHLNYSSITVAGDYGYNYIYNSNGNKELSINIDYLNDNNIFKICYFNAIMPSEYYTLINTIKNEKGK